MKICAVQYRSIANDIAANVAKHARFVEAASGLGADLVVFPELSITGYETGSARALAGEITNPAFAPLQTIANAKRIDIVFGFPALAHSPSATHCEIGMAWFSANAPARFYAKQLLHSDELPYFVPGQGQLVVSAQQEQLAPAICYESLQMSHAERAAELRASVYLSSVAKSAAGVGRALLHYPEVAKRFGMWVIMSNSIGLVDNFVSAGGSAAWNKNGELLAQLGSDEEGFLVLDSVSGKAEAARL